MRGVWYNVITKDGRTMLLHWVETRSEAERWLSHYKDYVGKPYPNGKGVYPDLGYKIVACVTL